MICGFLWVLQLPPSTNKTDRHDITEILLKVALNTIALTLTTYLRKLLFIRWVDTSEEVTGYPSARAQESTPCFSEMHVAQSWFLCSVLWASVCLFVLFLWVCFWFLITSSVFFILIWELALYFYYILVWSMVNVIRPEINISAIFRTGTSLKYIYKNYIEMREWME